MSEQDVRVIVATRNTYGIDESLREVRMNESEGIEKKRARVVNTIRVRANCRDASAGAMRGVCEYTHTGENGRMCV